MTSRKSDKLSWDSDGKTVEAPSSYSQQRRKARPALSWGEDANTVARPRDASLPADAFRPDSGVVEPASAPVPEPVESAPAARHTAPVQRAARGAWRRWVLLACGVPLCYALSYTAVRTAQRFEHNQLVRSEASSRAAQLWSALAEVLEELLHGPPGSQ